MIYAAGLLFISVLATAVAAAAPVRWGFALVVAAAVLVPAPLVVPNGFTGLLTLDRVLLVAFTVALAVRARRGRAGAGPRPFAVTPVHLAFVGFLAVAIVLGLLTALPTTSTGTAGQELVDLVEQFLFFVAALAAIRAIGDTDWVLRVVAVVLVGAAVIALAEHVTGHGFSQAIFRGLPTQQGVAAAAPLETRLGQVRVRAGAEFALEFAWMVVALVPTLLVAAGRLPRRWLPLVPAAVVLALLATYWSYSRSALVGLAVAALVLVLGARDRRATGLTGSALVGLAVAALAIPSLLAVYSVGADPGSIAVRGQRLPEIFGLLADRPIRGLGLSGLLSFGFPVTDSSYLKVYAELGVVGLAAFGVLLVTATVCAARGLLAADVVDRRPAAAALAGVVVLLVSALVFDALTLLGSARLLWLLVALGIAAAEASRGPLARVEWLSLRRLELPVLGAVAGLALIALWPTHSAQTYLFATLPTAREAGGYDPVDAGNVLIGTACGIVTAEPLPGAHADCVNVFAGAGIGRLRVQAATPTALFQATTTLVRAVRETGLRFALSPAPGAGRGQPTAIATAPAWLAVLGLGVAVLMPTPGEPPPRPVEPARPVPARAQRERQLVR